MKSLVAIVLAVVTAIGLHAQGYIVPNGVYTNLFPGEIDVWNLGPQITGFMLEPWGRQAPAAFTNIFRFDEPITIGVRVFLVSPNDPISLRPTVANAHREFQFGETYVFQSGAPFYVGLYTGAGFAPPYPPNPPFFYLDPVFGWAKLVNNRGVIQEVDYAVAHQAQGIFAGTTTIIPEPSSATLAMLGILALAFRRLKKSFALTPPPA
ncbi:MAG: hypothetical protein M9920_06265 [Verrucomicrobiae bacterium]|nr:hypothetical protein [Verrucomicrobiae bacterium]